MTELAKVEKEDPERKGVVIFGVDITKIECMRGSLLNGYAGAAVGGVGGFLYTSKWRIACHSAFASFWVVAFSSWFVCRYQKYQREKHWEFLKRVVNEKAASENEYHLPKEFMTSNENKLKAGKES